MRDQLDTTRSPGHRMPRLCPFEGIHGARRPRTARCQTGRAPRRPLGCRWLSHESARVVARRGSSPRRGHGHRDRVVVAEPGEPSLALVPQAAAAAASRRSCHRQTSTAPVPPGHGRRTPRRDSLPMDGQSDRAARDRLAPGISGQRRRWIPRPDEIPPPRSLRVVHLRQPATVVRPRSALCFGASRRSHDARRVC